MRKNWAERALATALGNNPTDRSHTHTAVAAALSAVFIAVAAGGIHHIISQPDPNQPVVIRAIQKDATGRHTTAAKVHAQPATINAHPVLNTHASSWIGAATKDAYFITPEDVVDFVKDPTTKSTIQEAMRLYRNREQDAASAEKFQKFMQEKNVLAVMTQATNEYLRSQYPEIHKYVRDEDDAANGQMAKFAEKLLRGIPYTHLVFDDFNNGQSRAAVILTSHRDQTTAEFHARLSGLPLAAHEHLIGSDKEAWAAELVHSIAHITYPEGGAINENLATSSARKAINLAVSNSGSPFSSGTVILCAEKSGTLGAIFKNDAGAHQPNTTIDLSAGNDHDATRKLRQKIVSHMSENGLDKTNPKEIYKAVKTLQQDRNNFPDPAVYDFAKKFVEAAQSMHFSKFFGYQNTVSNAQANLSRHP